MKPITNIRIPGWTFIAAATLAGLLARWWHLGKASIWHDEGFSIMLAQLSPAEIVERTAHDVHPPLYYLVLHYWMNLFGTGEAAIRSLSMLCTVAIVPLTYVLVRRLWNERSAQLAALFVALGPMLVRYGQEARMYGLAALFVLASVYCLVRAMERNRWQWWSLYALSLAAAMYTHYYSLFILPALLAWVTLHTNRKKGSGWWNYRWWLSNLGAFLLFSPWLPSVYDQLTRRKNFSWIPAVDATTLPNTLLQFLAFMNPTILSSGIKLAAGGLFMGLLLAAWRMGGKRRQPLLLFGLYGLTGPLLIYIFSFSGSPYLERYFTYAAVGFYCLLALMVTQLGRRTQLAAIVAILVLFGLGSYSINTFYTHDMRSLSRYVNQHYQPGDYLLSDIFLSYFDFSYYNHTGAPVHLWEADGINGYGETSLLKKKEHELILRDAAALQPASGRLWMISKLDKPRAADQIPSNWKPVGPKMVFADNALQRYLVEPRSQK
ncbi:MAG TPA: glycosyltransferase family 39 protein [Candidatus Polarisedimenticolaceae bacterium]|nr:glycosyltransferase family 39 protein [Candidatus Polarisedimenticolaceae bacterium]